MLLRPRRSQCPANIVVSTSIGKAALELDPSLRVMAISQTSQLSLPLAAVGPAE
jgi:hypothetical protein